MAQRITIRGRLKRQVKLALAGEDIDALVAGRDRRRLRWIAQYSQERVPHFRALRLLAEMRDQDSGGLFTGLLAEDPGALPTPVVRTAAEGLGRLRDPHFAPVLKRLLRPNRPSLVQVAAARALSMLGREEDWRLVRTWALRVASGGSQALFTDWNKKPSEQEEQVPGCEAVVAVIRILYADKNETWWQRKAQAWLKSKETSFRVPFEQGADQVVAQAHRRNLEEKKSVGEDFDRTVLLLGSLARDRDFPFLLSLLQEQRDPVRRQATARALGRGADPRSVPMMIKWLEEIPDSRPDLAATMVQSAGHLSWPELARPLAEIRARHSSIQVREGATWAIGECGGEAAVHILVEQIRSRTDELSENEFLWTARALQRCGNRGREAIRGGLAIARAGGGERDRMKRLAQAAGIH